MSKEEVFSRIEQIHPQLHGWSSLSKCKRMAELIYDNAIQQSLEIGIYGGKGLLSFAIAHEKVGGKTFGVDPWEYQDAIDEDNGQTNDQFWRELDYVRIMRDFFGAMFHYELAKNTFVLRCSSEDAKKMLSDKEFGFIHIDGNHSEKTSVEDVTFWAPTVIKGGFIVMDDTNWASTKKAQSLLVEKLGFKELDRIEEDGQEWAIYRKAK